MTLKPTEKKRKHNVYKINQNEIFRKNRNGSGKISFCSVSNTSTRLQLSVVIQTTRTGTTLCKLMETWIFLLPWKRINFYAKRAACDNVRTVWFHQTKRVCNEAADQHYIHSLLQAFSFLKYFHSNHSLLQNYISGRKEAVHIKYVSGLGLRVKLDTFQLSLVFQYQVSNLVLQPLSGCHLREHVWALSAALFYWCSSQRTLLHKAMSSQTCTKLL